MSKLFQIQLSNGNMYVTRETDIEDFFKHKIYKLKKGCVVRNTVTQNGQGSTQLFDISKNFLYDLPIFIQTSCINEVATIIKGSELDKLYVKVTSNIILN